MRHQKYNSFSAATLLSILCVLAGSGNAFAADEQESGKVKPNDASSFTASDVELDELPVGILERIEGGFKVAVDALGSVLFYKVGAEDIETITIKPAVLYTRPLTDDGKPVDADADFTRRTDIASQPETLKLTQVRKLAAEGKLVYGDGKEFAKGTLNGKRVEVVLVKRDDLPEGFKYGDSYQKVTEDGESIWKKKLPKRELLSDEQTLTLPEIEDLAQAGLLATGDKDGAGKAKDFISNGTQGGMPLIVAWLSFGAVVFTLYMGFFNLRGFRHAINVVRGKFDNPENAGEVTHFQALASALSATVGLGNIGGVTIAMTLGGPGAFFWMLFCGFFGMSAKFVECTLGQKYRHVDEDGHILGGPMRYLSAGLKEMNLGPLGATLALIFAVMCVLASFGGGNMYQSNQSGDALLASVQAEARVERAELQKKIKAAAEADDTEKIEELSSQRDALSTRMEAQDKNFRIWYGAILAVLVGFVILGGIKRIGKAAEKIVPSMCGLYLLMCIYIIGIHIADVPALIGSIFTEAFSATAMGGGLVGVMVVGIQRAAFSNEAGVGSAAIAHSAAKTDEPVREGTVALLGPFIDTIIVCSMTALVILITGAWDNTQWIVDDGLQGAGLTSRALQAESPDAMPMLFPWMLSIAVVLFAFSTIISWSYYGERCWEELFGRKSTVFYKVLAVIAVFIGAIFNLGAVLDFSDIMILSMAFPNVLGALLLAPKVKKDLKEYWARYKSGEMKTYS